MLPRIPLPRHTRNIPVHVHGTLLGVQSFIRGEFLRLADRNERPDAPMQMLLRYSVFLPHIREWQLVRKNSVDAYRAALFAPERLAQRLTLLRGIVLPSLAGQSLPMRRGLRELIVFTSDELPADHRADLEAALAPYDWARTHPLPASTTSFPHVGPAGPHLSLRLDDDDALSRDYLARISVYWRPSCEGHVITFPVGYLLRLRPDAPPGFGLIWRPKLSVGLTYFVAPDTRYRAITDLMDHNRADRLAPTIFGDGAPAWLRTVYDGQDSKDHRRNYSDPRLTLARVQRDFDFDPARLTPPQS